MVEQTVLTAGLLNVPPGDRDAAKLAVLRLLAERPDLSQRELAERLGVSIGKANYIVRALIDKGLIKARNFRRSDNKLAYAYVLTPGGINAKIQLTRAFLTRKEAEFVSLREQIAALHGELSAPPEAAAAQESTTS
jgi:EPS-associated MarR family transcriptional regulator